MISVALSTARFQAMHMLLQAWLLFDGKATPSLVEVHARSPQEGNQLCCQRHRLLHRAAAAKPL